MRLFVWSLTAVVMAGAATLGRAEILFSENFSGGNPANSSDYSLIAAATNTLPGEYRIVNNPADPTFQNNYGSVFDHTTGDASGAMLFFDGSSNSNDRIYYRSANLVAGVPYQFSYWQEADNLGSPPQLDVLVNGTSLGTLQNSFTQSWAEFNATFTPANSGTYTFSIIDLNTVALYNDGALDDIQLTSPLLLGDANGDGKVDLNDLNAVLNHLGETDNSRADGNFDGAPTIDLTDLNDVLNNLGTSTAGSAASTNVGVAAPEPASLGILGIAGVLLMRRRHKKRHAA